MWNIFNVAKLLNSVLIISTVNTPYLAQVADVGTSQVRRSTM